MGGLNPDPFKISALYEMSKVKLKMDWDRTSALMALLMNIHRDPKKKTIDPVQLNPFRESVPAGRTIITSENFEQIANNFVQAGKFLKKEV